MSTDSIGQVSLRVQPEQLAAQAVRVRSHLDRMTTRFAELERLVSGTRRYWLGEAGTAYRDIYLDNAEPIGEMLRRLREYPEDLLKVSGNYTRTENQLSELAGSLGTNVIH